MSSRFFELDPANAYMPVEPVQLAQIQRQIDTFFDSQRRFWEEDVRVPTDLDEDLEQLLGPTRGLLSGLVPLAGSSAPLPASTPGGAGGSSSGTSRRERDRDRDREASQTPGAGAGSATTASSGDDGHKGQRARRKPQPLASKPTQPPHLGSSRPGPATRTTTPSAPRPLSERPPSERVTPPAPRPPAPPRPSSPPRAGRRKR